MNEKKWNVTTKMLLITILALENFAYLIPLNEYLIKGLFKFSDIGLIMSIIWTIWVYNCVKTTKRIKYKYSFIISAFIVMTLISSIMSNKFFGQPVSWGFRSMRNQMICFILYFSITRALQCGALKKKDLKKIIYIVGTFELIIFSLQYVLVNKITFTYIDTEGIRYGTARLRFPYLFPLMVGFLSLGNLLKTNENKYIDIIYIAWSAFLLGGICKHRAPTLILFFTIFIGYLIWKKNIGKKIIIGCLTGAMLVSFIYNTEIVQSSIMGLTEKNTKEDTLTIRKDGQNYYLEQVQKSKLFGFGMPNLNNSQAMAASGANRFYYLADNGIYGFYYIYGLLGIIWLVFFWWKNLSLSFKQYNLKNCSEYLLYFIFETGNLYIGLHWFYYYTLPFMLMVSLLDYDNYELDEERNFYE